MGATHVDIEHGVSYDSSYVEIEPVSERMETDEEYKIRIDEEARRKEEAKQRDLNMLESLKLKYES